MTCPPIQCILCSPGGRKEDPPRAEVRTAQPTLFARVDHGKQMTYKTDGSVHHGGVKNEDLTVQILNEKQIYSETVEKRGGTKCKEDAVAGDKKISIKRKEGISNGSFDWFNTSTYNDVLGDTFDHFLSNMKELRQMPESLRSDEEFVLKIRDSFNQLCELSLDSLTSAQVIEILQRGLIEHNAGFDLVINDTKTSELYKFSAEQHPAVGYIQKGYSVVLKGNGKSSRMVYFVDADGNVYDCGLRIRVTSNNGINAFLGTSKANRNSQVVIKLQQDKVGKLLQEVKAECVTY